MDGEEQPMATLTIAGEQLKVSGKSDNDKLFLHRLQKILKSNKISRDVMRVDMPTTRYEEYKSDEEDAVPS